jgi:hypothetical protein
MQTKDSVDKKLFKSDLLERVNELLKLASPGVKPIAMRTLEKDIADMQLIYGVKILKLSEHKRAYYAYARPDMSIGRSGLRSTEQARLWGVLNDLSRFRGIDGFGWWTEMEALMRWRFQLVEPQKGEVVPIMAGHESSNAMVPRVQEYRSLRWLKHAVHALQLQVPARVGFAKPNSENLERHSMLVESVVEQRSGWMVLALVWDNEAQEAFRLVLPINAIVSWDDVLVDIPDGLKGALPFDWSHYVDQRFELAAGVVLDADEQPVTLRIWFEMQTAMEYVAQPFHPSQDPKIERSGAGIVMQAYFVPNAPFRKWLLHHGATAQLLEPADLRESLGTEVQSLAASYSKMFGP